MGNIVSYPVSVTIDFSANATTATTTDVPVEGYLVGLSCVAPDLDSTHTYTVTLTDNNGATVFTEGSLAEDTTTDIWDDSNSVTLKRPVVRGGLDVKVVTSGNQTSDREFTIYLYTEV